MSVSIKIKGFRNREEALAFMNWYQHQGEQDIEFWMELREQEGMDVRTHLICKNIDEENLVMDVSE